MDEQGYVKSWRKKLDNLFLMKDNNAYLVFDKLLLLANHKTGQYVTGRNKLADIMNLKARTLYDVLIRLEKNGLINIASNNKYSIITICKYHFYQGETNKTPNIYPTSRQHPDNNATTLNKNKELRIKNNLDKSKLAPPNRSKPDINEMLDFWEATTGSPITAQVQKNRFACSNLLKKHGKDNLKRMIGGVAYSHGQQFAPSIANFIQLQAKWDELVVWGKKYRKQSDNNYLIIPED